MGQKINCQKITDTILANIKNINNVPNLHIITSEVDTEITFDDIAIISEQVGINCINLNVSTIDNFYQTIDRLNNDDKCRGIFINTLYKSFIEHQVNIYSLINPMKDVSAKNIIATGLTIYNNNIVYQPKIMIVMRLLQELDLKLAGLPVTIVDFNNELSPQLAALLLNKGCNITICNQYTKNLRRYTKYNEVIISLIGKKYKYAENGIKDDSIFIDLDILDGTNNSEFIKEKFQFYTEAAEIKQLYIAYILYNFIRLLQLST